MKKIKQLIEYVDEELHDSKKYIKEAVDCKNVDQLIFDTAVRLATQEMQHASDWHDVIVAEIDKERKDLAAKGETVPNYMIEMWNDEHEEYIEEMAKLKYELEMLKK